MQGYNAAHPTTSEHTMSKASEKRAEQADAIQRLRGILKPGDTIYCVLKRVSSSGMSRIIDFYKIDGEGKTWLGPWIALALGMTRTGAKPGEPEGIRVSGCGMDMGFHVVYNVGRVIFPDGFGLPYPGSEGERPSSPEEAAILVALGTKFYGRNGDTSGWDNDGGYALKHEWL